MDKEAVIVNYSYEGNDDNVVFRFVSDFEPIVIDGKVVIEGMRIESKNGLTPSITVKEYRSHFATTENAYLIDFKVEGKKEINAEFAFILE